MYNFTVTDHIHSGIMIARAHLDQHMLAIAEPIGSGWFNVSFSHTNETQGVRSEEEFCELVAKIYF